MMNSPAAPRRFLFLQGVATLFFDRLGRRLAGLGHCVHRINFNAGDRLFWSLPGAVDYRDRPKAWPTFFESCLKAWNITDIVLFGDWRPMHAQAISIASWRGLRVHVFEEGYLRPYWITLERGGVNRNSALPRDPDWYRAQGAGLPAWRQPAPIHGDFLPRAAMDVGYHVWRWLMSWRFPNYQSHLPVSPFREYRGWIGRFLRRGSQRRRRARVFQALGGRRFFLYPLPLDTDSQMRLHSEFGRQQRAIAAVLQSFARHAPPGATLLLKEHPLDPQIEDWAGIAAGLAATLGIAGRVHYLRGGDIASLMPDCRGMVTVNSTSGMQALECNVPVLALGRPIYDMPGLTFQQGLDRFWKEAAPPDGALFDAFRRVVVRDTQIHGSFYCPAGVRLAVDGAVERLTGMLAVSASAYRGAPLAAAGKAG